MHPTARHGVGFGTMGNPAWPINIAAAKNLIYYWGTGAGMLGIQQTF